MPLYKKGYPNNAHFYDIYSSAMTTQPSDRFLFPTKLFSIVKQQIQQTERCPFPLSTNTSKENRYNCNTKIQMLKQWHFTQTPTPYVDQLSGPVHQNTCKECLPIATFSNSDLKFCALIWTTVLGNGGQAQKWHLNKMFCRD